MKMYGGVKVNFSTRWGDWSASCHGYFTSRERAPGTHWIGGWVGPRDSLDVVVKRKDPCSCWEWNPCSLVITILHLPYFEMLTVILGIAYFLDDIFYFCLDFAILIILGEKYGDRS